MVLAERRDGPSPFEKSVVRTKEVFFRYALEVDEAMFRAVRRGEGKGYTGTVPGRPGEKQIMMDAAGERLLNSLVRDSDLSAIVLGEQDHYVFFEGTPDIIVANDSLDNSSQYRRGLPSGLFSVASGYTEKGDPVGSVTINIKEREAMFNLGGSDNFIVDLSDPSLPFRKVAEAPRRKTIIGNEEITISSFQGEKAYKEVFDKNFSTLIHELHPKAFFDSGGGSYIYSQLATGSVDMYIMFDEPHSEILPGLPMALAAKCTAISVNLEDGSYSDYRFDPSFITNPREYSHGSVPLFIASRTPELAEEAIRYYMKRNKIKGNPRKLDNNA